MSDQYELDLRPLEVGQDDSIPARFHRFHAANPAVYRALVFLAREFRAKRPSSKMGIGMLYEVLRWNYYMETNSQEEYKLSNDFRAPYARLIMASEPDLADAFNTKSSISDQ